jgi:hypothetical protein
VNNFGYSNKVVGIFEEEERKREDLDRSHKLVCEPGEGSLKGSSG